MRGDDVAGAGGPERLVPEAVVDAHMHLWREADLAPGDVVGDPRLRRDFLWDDYEAEGGHGVEAAVAVAVRERLPGEATPGPSHAPGGDGDRDGDRGGGDPRVEPDEVEFLAGQGRIQAITAFAPLEAPDAGARLAELAKHPLVRAVRRNTQDEPDPAFAASPAFVRGARLAGDLGLVCEICARHHQLDAVVRLAAGCPGVQIVLDHLGKPDLSERFPLRWRRDIARLAGFPNVACKVSVVVGAAGDPPLSADAVAPFVEHVIDRFGWSRVMFGSNWPVAGVVTGYRDWVGILDRILAGASPADRALLFAGTAGRLYGLTPRG